MTVTINAGDKLAEARQKIIAAGEARAEAKTAYKQACANERLAQKKFFELYDGLSQKMPLFDPPANGAATNGANRDTANGSANGRLPPRSWRDTPLLEVFASRRICMQQLETLSDAGITNLGEMEDFRAKRGEFNWELPGIGVETRTKMEEAILDWLAQNLGSNAPGLDDAGQPLDPDRKCIVCGCTEFDREQCIERTGDACEWLADDLHDVCSACVEPQNRKKTDPGRVQSYFPLDVSLAAIVHCAGISEAVTAKLRQAGLRSYGELERWLNPPASNPLTSLLTASQTKEVEKALRRFRSTIESMEAVHA